MSGVQQVVFQNQRSFVTLPDIGEAYEGGYFAGQISTAGNGTADYNIVVGPLSTTDAAKQWKNATSATAGTFSLIDGPQNTADIVALGSSTVYPAAHFCNSLTVGGFSDWYMAAQNELEVCYFNLKPNTTVNSAGYPISGNANAVPALAGPYTSGDPAQTSAAVFQTGGAQAFAGTPYWVSAQGDYDWAGWCVSFERGSQTNYFKTSFYRVRAVRRVAV